MTRAPKMAAPSFEVHEHCIISGPNAHKSWANRISHSHEGGNTRHQHADTDPASFTIDKDQWLRDTGLKGGGRKKFTRKPTGEQMPVVEMEDWQNTFEVIICEPGAPPGYEGEGPGIALPMRMIHAFGMTARVRRAGSK